MNMRNDIYSLVNEINNMFYKDGGYKSFPIDVVEIENGYEVYAEIPGVNKEDVEITFEDGNLTIIATPNKSNEKKYLVHERNSMKLKRTICFNEIDEDKITAKYENGILVVTILTKVVEAKQAKSIVIE